jgi:hypothetical protein
MARSVAPPRAPLGGALVHHPVGDRIRERHADLD